ncbi:amidohydrolase family protein [Stella sp.]|uniref:amidohydrolase family protein n=1 Tax=Stella sp. TaxID=2912054 RepID=UPI0035B3ECA6
MTHAIALDVHAHIAPVLPDRIAALPGIEWDPAAPKLVIDGAPLAAPSVFRPEALVRWMDERGVGRAWISIPPPLYRLGLDEAASRVWHDYVNDGLAAMAGRFPDRLSPLFHLPIQHPGLAARIVAEKVAAGHVRFAAAAGSATHGSILSDAAYEPLWVALDGAAGFLFLHPTKGCDGRLDPFFLHNLLGGPGETALAAAHLAMSGIMDRHRRMRVCLAHGGGTAPAVAGRLTRGQTVRRPGAYVGARPADEAFRGFCADCITHSAPALELAAAVFGEDRILFGSDWPFSMGLPDPEAQLADVRPALKARIFAADADRLPPF